MTTARRPAQSASDITPLPLTDLIDNLSGLNRTIVHGMTNMNRAVLHDSSLILDEWMSFVRKRLVEDISAAQRLAHCTCGAEVSKTCTEFWQRLADQYQTEFTKALTLWSRLASEGPEAFTKGLKSSTALSGETAGDREACKVDSTIGSHDTPSLPEAARSHHH